MFVCRLLSLVLSLLSCERSSGHLTFVLSTVFLELSRFVLNTAYIGDVVFELYIRSRHVWPSRRTSDLQDCVVAIVRGVYIS
jgi:hypothetical protein